MVLARIRPLHSEEAPRESIGKLAFRIVVTDQLAELSKVFPVKSLHVCAVKTLTELPKMRSHTGFLHRLPSVRVDLFY